MTGKLPELSSDDFACPHCENPNVEVLVEKGYAIVWDDALKDLNEYKKQGMKLEEALTKSINKNMTYITGSDICRVKTESFIKTKFWEIFASNSKIEPLSKRVDDSIHQLVVYFKEKYPNSWKCFIGEDNYERKVKTG